MGREKKILLGFLGMLAGVFVGALAVKLLVPRPPAGAGPDIRSEAAVARERVEPPALAPGSWDFSGAPPLVPDPPAAASGAQPPSAPPPRSSRFAAASPAEPDPRPDAVTPASWQQADVTPPAMPDIPAAATTPPPVATVDRFGPPPLDAASSRDPFDAPAPRAAPVAGAYLVQAGDSWWDLAERAYGDGRLYRALFAWNRARDRRISLAPGTHLDVPPLARLEAAWPRLLPAPQAAQRRSASFTGQ